MFSHHSNNHIYLPLSNKPINIYMKTKLALLALACGFTFAANAQSTTDETLKPVAGDKTIEVGLDLDGGFGGQLRLRKFSTSQLAYRYGANISFDNTKVSEDASFTRFNLHIAPGMEKHFAGTRRLSPYIGFAVPIGVGTSHYESDIVKVKGAITPDGGSQKYLSAGLTGLAGVDLYIIKNFYVGFEVGLGAYYTNYGDAEAISKQDASNNKTIKGYHDFDFRNFTQNGIRVGYAF